MRYHVVWALARKSQLIGGFYEEPVRTGLYGLLDSPSEAEETVPGSRARMERIGSVSSRIWRKRRSCLRRHPRSVPQPLESNGGCSRIDLGVRDVAMP